MDKRDVTNKSRSWWARMFSEGEDRARAEEEAAIQAHRDAAAAVAEAWARDGETMPQSP